jgi:polyphosphate kinase 2 (PPK2 family)
LEIDLVNNFVVRSNTQIKLIEWNSIFTGEMDKKYAENLLYNEFENQLSNLQYKLFADKNQALLIILQGIDKSGKDSTIRHVMNAFNPQSCKVVSFKKPNESSQKLI